MVVKTLPIGSGKLDPVEGIEIEKVLFSQLIKSLSVPSVIVVPSGRLKCNPFVAI